MPGTVAEFNTGSPTLNRLRKKSLTQRQPINNVLATLVLAIAHPSLGRHHPLHRAKTPHSLRTNLPPSQRCCQNLPLLLWAPRHQGATTKHFHSKSFANWTRQLCLCLADDIRSYVLDDIVPDDWTALQHSTRDAIACNIIANSIKIRHSLGHI
ncbi:BQ2448_4459 [Microbotryum intermedium]|uniref:BQ2448_4459 protein n=1 Tax=Microbotryum intermedium TaxID=269621 RepID=A0A238FEY7_9BASI|nr:BQ2448_4459 [Microbotryum intermedium]